VTLEGVNLHLIDSVAEASELMTWLGERGHEDSIGCDTETTGLNTRTDKLRMVQVGDEMTGWSIPWERWGGVFEELVRKWDGDYDFHNAIFDTDFLDREGVVIPRSKIHDTRPMFHILEPTYSTALKNLSARYIDARAAGMQQALDTAIGSRGGWTWASVPVTFGAYWQYAALDPVLTKRLKQEAWPRLVSDDVMVAYELERAVQWIIQRMQRNGVHVDANFARTKFEQFTHYCDKVEAWCKNTYNVSPGSNQAVIEVLKRDGVEFTKRTKGGALSLDSDVLESIQHPLAEAVLQRRQLQKIASTYLLHMFTQHDADDLLHPSINPLGARTSRMSMSDPNLQNLPRISEAKPAATTVRTGFTTRYRESGGLMMFCDFDQIEMRGLAHLCQDKGMKDAFLSAGDFFVNLARQVFRDDTIEKKDARRQITKNVGYGKIYGAGIAKLALTAGVSEEQAAAAMHAFDASFPMVRSFQNLVQRTALDRKSSEGVGYVRSPLTRRRHPSDDGKEYALVNYLIQGLAAEMFKMKLLELDAAGLGEWMCLPVHDEVILDVPAEHIRDAAHALQQVMNDEKLLSVPITASVSVGESWGQKRAYDA